MVWLWAWLPRLSDAPTVLTVFEWYISSIDGGTAAVSLLFYFFAWTVIVCVVLLRKVPEYIDTEQCWRTEVGGRWRRACLQESQRKGRQTRCQPTEAARWQQLLSLHVGCLWLCERYERVYLCQIPVWERYEKVCVRCVWAQYMTKKDKSRFF